MYLYISYIAFVEVFQKLSGWWKHWTKSGIVLRFSVRFCVGSGFYCKSPWNGLWIFLIRNIPGVHSIQYPTCDWMKNKKPQWFLTPLWFLNLARLRSVIWSAQICGYDDGSHGQHCCNLKRYHAFVDGCYAVIHFFFWMIVCKMGAGCKHVYILEGGVCGSVFHDCKGMCSRVRSLTDKVAILFKKSTKMDPFIAKVGFCAFYVWTYNHNTILHVYACVLLIPLVTFRIQIW